jgi:hypothetical protein
MLKNSDMIPFHLTTLTAYQNPAQRRFTAKTSPLNAAFIIEELKREAQ